MALNMNRFSSMVQEYFVSRIRQADARRLAARAKLKTRKDALRLQVQVRRGIAASFGPLPQRTPLNARITGRIEHDAFTIEKVIFESRPGFMVTGNLYIPKGLTGPAPAVLFTCGHSQDGKAAASYQTAQHVLALKGFVVLGYDPVSQGERVQYPDDKGLPSLGLCDEHTMIGRQQALVGEFLGTWRAWDGIRGVDYLESRSEVDPARIGVTGQSGGGTMTTWMTALEPRFAMSAPACFTTTLACNLENECFADAEQIPPGLIAAGLDQYDVLIAHAPKPLILLTAENDFFDQRGALQAFEQLRRVWKLLGKEDNIRMTTAPGGHALGPVLRESLYGFFTRHAGMKPSPKEPQITLHKQQELFATPEGSTLKAGSKRIFDFTQQKAAEVKAARKPLPAAKLPAAIEELLALPPRKGVVHHRVLRERGDGAHRWTNFALQTEPGILAIVNMPMAGWEYRVPAGTECTIIVPHLSAHDDITSGVLGEDLGVTEASRQLQPPPARKQVFGVDYRGVGESLPSAGYGTAGGPTAEAIGTHSADYFHHCYGLLMGEPLLGRRVHDVLCTIDWVRAHGYRKIHVIGRGMGSLVAALAAVVDRKLASVTLVNALLSWDELMQTPIFAWPSSCLPTGVLSRFDLADCLRAIGKKLTLVRPWDAQMAELPADMAARRVAELGLTCPLVTAPPPARPAVGDSPAAAAIA